MKKLWEAKREVKETSVMHQYLQFLKKKDLSFPSYQELHSWSTKKPEEFWPSLIDFFSPLFSGSTIPSFHSLDFLDYSWFPQLHLNFAENLMRFCEEKNNNKALHFYHESGLCKTLSFSQLHKRVQGLQAYLQTLIEEGDVVAAYMPNLPETIETMLATTSLGGIFTSTSSDFGTQGVIDRFGQTKPKVFVAASRYTYNGKEFDLTPRIQEIQKAIPSIQKVLLVDFLSTDTPPSLEGAIGYEEALCYNSSHTLFFKKLPFHAPLYIMYSSGTTGKPKCIVHTAGGTLLNHIYRSRLKNRLDRV